MEKFVDDAIITDYEIETLYVEDSYKLFIKDILKYHVLTHEEFLKLFNDYKNGNETK